MGVNLQSKAEELIYDALDDISDELEISCDASPEVYFAHKTFSFGKLGVPKVNEEDFNIIKKFGGGVYFRKPKIILLSSFDPIEIYEEAGHFLHFNYSGLTFNGKSEKDELFMNAIIESIGYFCSKLGDSTRTPLFGDYPDYFENREECLKEIDSKDIDPSHFFIYQQGYGIGEDMFNSYISGNISKGKIRELMSEKFEGKYEAMYSFIKLKRLFDDNFFLGHNIMRGS